MRLGAVASGSRDTGFVDGVRAHTGGRGVDVVLNSLGGELMRASLDCLAPFGRFLELGVRDIHEGGALELCRSPGRPPSRHQRRSGYARLRGAVCGADRKVANGTLCPLPYDIFPVDRTPPLRAWRSQSTSGRPSSPSPRRADRRGRRVRAARRRSMPAPGPGRRRCLGKGKRAPGSRGGAGGLGRSGIIRIRRRTSWRGRPTKARRPPRSSARDQRDRRDAALLHAGRRPPHRRQFVAQVARSSASGSDCATCRGVDRHQPGRAGGRPPRRRDPDSACRAEGAYPLSHAQERLCILAEDPAASVATT